MKKTLKLSLYIGIPIVFVAAIFLFRMESKQSISIGNTPPQGPASQGANNRSKALPVSVYIADYLDREAGSLRLGTLVANETLTLVSELSGRVIEINFQEGQLVHKGDVLLRLNDDELKVQLVRAEYRYRLLEERLERQKILLEKDAVSREDYDMVQTEFNVLKQDIEELNIKIDKMMVRAPFDGQLGFREVSLGAFLQPGSKISYLVDHSKLKLEFSIPEKYATGNLLGAKARFTVEGSAETHTATVYAVDPQIDIATRTVMLRALYENRSGLLRPGMSARVQLTPNTNQQALFVPNQAVVPSANGRFVWVKKEGVARMTPVQTGTRTTEMLEILSGVQAGDSIIVTGLMQLREGMMLDVEKTMIL